MGVSVGLWLPSFRLRLGFWATAARGLYIDSPAFVKVFFKLLLLVLVYRALVWIVINDSKRVIKFYLDNLDNMVIRRRLIRRQAHLDRTEKTLRFIWAKDKFLPKWRRKEIKKVLKDIEHLREVAREFAGEGTTWVVEHKPIQEGESIDVMSKSSLLNRVLEFPFYVKLPLVLIFGWSMFFIVVGVAKLIERPLLPVHGWLSIGIGLLIASFSLVYLRSPEEWIETTEESGA